MSEYEPGEQIEYLWADKWHPATYVGQGKDGAVIYLPQWRQTVETHEIRRANDSH